MSKTINHNALKHLAEANAVTTAHADADGDIWSLKVLVGNDEKVVMAKNSGEPRKWRKLDTLAKYLKGIGLEKFEINISNFDPSVKSLQRPDSASTLKRTHREANISIMEKSNKASALIPEDNKSIQEVKEKWEERRMRILREENPRAK